MDWIVASKKRSKTEEGEKNHEKSRREINLKRLKSLKEEGISFAEKDCPWQAVGRWDEALLIRVSGSTPKDLEHEKLLEMKAQALINLHEWEPAIEALNLALKRDLLT